MSQTILVVEDEAITLLDLQRHLQDFGYATMAAASGEKALSLAAMQRPDMVLLDIHLAGNIDGIVTAERLRDELGLTAIIYLTAHLGDDLLARAKQTHPYGYLIKPVTKNELHATLEMALKRLALDRQLQASHAEIQKREKKYRQLFESMTQGVIYQDAAGRVIDVNPAALELLGFAQAQVAGRSPAEHDWPVVDEDYQPLPPNQRPTAVALSTGRPVKDRVQGIFNPQRQSYVWVVVNAIPQFKPGETEPYQVFVTLHDITERKQAEQVERRYRRIVSATPDSMSLIDRYYRYQIVNETYCIRTGLDYGEIVNHTVAEVMGEEIFQSLVKKNLDRALAGETVNYRAWFEFAQTGRCFMDVTYAPYRDEDGSIAGVVVSGRDLTDIELAEEKLRQSHLLLQKLSAQVPGMLFQYRQQPDGRATAPFASPAIQDILGITPEQVRDDATPLFAGVHPDDYGHLLDTLNRSAAALTPWRCEYRVDVPGRGLRWLYGEAVPERLADGSILWHGYLHDISDRKQVEFILQGEINLNQAIACVAEESLSADLSINYVAEIVHSVTTGMTGSQYGFVSSIDPVTGDNVAHKISDMMPDPQHPDSPVIFVREPAGYRGLWGYSLQTREPFFTNEPAAHPASRGTPAGHISLRRFLAVPAMAGGQLLGQIALANAARDYTEQDVSNVSRIATVYALAILRKRYEDNLLKAMGETRTLYAASLALSAAADLPAVLLLILEELQQVVTYDSASVQVLHDHYFEIIDGLGFEDRSKIIGIRFDIRALDSEKQILETRRPVIINDTKAQNWEFYSPYDHLLRSWMGVPLLFGERVIGKLGIDKHEPDFFTDRHAELAMAFAAQAAIAIENARLFEEIKQARRRAEAASQAKSQFLASMSHELRTPLNGILGYTQILKKDPTLSTEHQHAIDTIHRSGQHLLLLINDVLDLARIEAGRLELNPTEFTLRPFLQTIVDINQVRAEAKGLAFHFRPAPDLPLTVEADERRLRQILLNLLGNAVKFTSAGSITFRVTVTGRLLPLEEWVEISELHFEIEDTGVGIAEADHFLIFDAFERVVNKSMPVDGTGLGLAITKQLVLMMNGKLSVKSQPDRGSLFVVEIAMPTASPPDAYSGPAPARAVVGYRTGAKARSVLLVDDQADNRAVLRDLLAPLGFTVAEAAAGQEAIRQAVARRPDLILMDLRMPGLDGYETTRQIRRQPGLDTVPVIAISASVAEEMVERCRAAGCDDFLGKPFSEAELLDKIGQHLRLEWIYQKDDAPASAPQPEPQSFRLPPPAAMAALFELAATGDVRGLRQTVEGMHAQHPECGPFLDRIGQFARQYRVDLIEEFLVELAPDLFNS